ncbi:unnamed protein product [Alopecurus aequalis]
MTIVRRSSFPFFLFLCFPLLATLCQTSDAVGSAMIQAINCSTSGNYTPSGAYAANLNQFLAALPENAVSRNGGFFNGTVGDGVATVYGLAMCSGEYSRADCGACLAATAGGNTGGLPSRCPGSTTVHALFDMCLVRYSDTNFLGTAETDIIYYSSGVELASPPKDYSTSVQKRLEQLTGEAVTSPQRFAASAAYPPFALTQCTWDLPPDKCKQCLDGLSKNASDWFRIKTEGERKSYSCSVRYSNTNFTVVPFSDTSSGLSPPRSSSVDQTATAAPPSTEKSSRIVAVGIVSVVGVVVVAALLAGWLWFRRQNKTQGDIEARITPSTARADMGESPPACNLVVHVPRPFTYAELTDATGNFAAERMLGHGAFGAVYKGTLPAIEGNVAIKVILDTSTAEAQKGFDNEIKIMTQLNHRNIVRLLGWCNEDNNLLLVYEKMKKRNLEDHLYPKNGITDSAVFGGADSSQLDWPRRRNILLGIASGLTYLHTECRSSIVHRDIKPANIMLDRNFNAVLGDFGLVTQVSHTQTSRETNNVIGTRLYIDPAYKQTGKACGQSDVYSFGVMLLEIVCGERPTLDDDGKNNMLVQKVQKCDMNNKILSAIDGWRPGRQFDKEIAGVLEIGLNCVHPDRHHRPHIGHVRNTLLDLVKSAASTSRNHNQSGHDEEADENPLLAGRQSTH